MKPVSSFLKTIRIFETGLTGKSILEGFEMNSAVTVTEPKLQTADFCQNCGEPKPRFLGDK